MQVRRLRQQPGDGGLAGARWPPEDKRPERARCQHPGERAIWAEQMVLPDDFVEFFRPQLVGKRTGRILMEACRGEQTGPTGFGACRHQNGSPTSCPRLSRPSTPCKPRTAKDVDARDKRGHDG